MNPTDTRLPTALEAAIGHVKTTASQVAEKVAATLGNQASSALRIIERDLLLATQIELRRKMNTFHLSFSKALIDKVQEEVTPRPDYRRKLADWQTLSLVEDSAVEERMFSDRVGQQISHACEWELREMAAYMGAVLNLGRADEDRNPLRADVLGMALYRAIESVTNDTDSRKLLLREFGLAMAAAMPECYATIVRDMQQRNVQPVGLTLKTVEGPGHLLPGLNSAYASVRDELPQTRPHGSSDFHGTSGTDFGSGGRSTGASFRGTAATQPASFAGGFGGGTTRSGGGGSGGGSGGGAGVGGGGGTGGGHVGGGHVGAGHAGGVSGGGGGSAAAIASDAELMTLLRRLTFLASRPGALDAPTVPHSTGYGAAAGRSRADAAGLHGAVGAMQADAAGAGYGGDGGLTGLMAVNLIRAHRDELLQASSGKLDHMVIDVVGSLFDQILSDTRVHPQMARQIARLQLPVLRVALVDSNFFSSRRHPVRRFVNRIASLACAFDDFDEGPGKQFLDRVRELVQDIVEGDFDQLEIYSAKLAALESFIAGQTETDAKQSGAATVLETKESELRIQQRYMLQLQSALSPIPMHDYLRDFVAQVWSQALVFAIRRHGVDSDLAKRFRQVGRDLIMSVQPKGSPVMRKRFLMQLPTLMKDLNEGLKLIGWPEAAQKEFFGKLLPSHAESLKAPPMSELDHNLMAKQLESIFQSTIPGAHEFSTAEPVTLASQEIEQRFSPDEAQKVGLVEERTVDWSGEVDIDLSADAAEDKPAGAEGAEAGDTLPADLGIDINLDLVAADPSEPSQGPRLIDHIRLGFAYQMLLKDQWQKVRLSYVSPGRNFFVFTRGRKHQETISLTSRMLARMCESNRMRAVEHAYLMERATARARKQLAALKVPTRQ